MTTDAIPNSDSKLGAYFVKPFHDINTPLRFVSLTYFRLFQKGTKSRTDLSLWQQFLLHAIGDCRELPIPGESLWIARVQP